MANISHTDRADRNKVLMRLKNATSPPRNIDMILVSDRSANPKIDRGLMEDELLVNDPNSGGDEGLELSQ